jgi:hypothetical protein
MKVMPVKHCWQHLALTDAACSCRIVLVAKVCSAEFTVRTLCAVHSACCLLRPALASAKLFELELQKQAQQLSAQRKAAAGMANTNERIRSYNYQDGRVSDHRVGLSINIDVPRFMAGDRLGEVIAAVKLQHQQQLLQEMLAEG